MRVIDWRLNLNRPPEHILDINKDVDENHLIIHRLCPGVNASALSSAKQSFALASNLYETFVGVAQLQGQTGYGAISTALTDACTNMSKSLSSSDGIPLLKALALSANVAAGGSPLTYKCIGPYRTTGPIYVQTNGQYFYQAGPPLLSSTVPHRSPSHCLIYLTSSSRTSACPCSEPLTIFPHHYHTFTQH